MKILISGDFFIADEYTNNELIDQSVIDLFHQNDYRILNLEAPIATYEPDNKILKTGPHLLMSKEKVIPYLQKLKVNAVTLANNHILDYGPKSLLDTFKSLRQNNIDYVGAGNNMKEAIKPLTIEKEGMRIALLNFCENEWSIANLESPGANPLDVIDNTKQIKAAKKTHDKVICIIHGGHEYYPLPSPRMQKQYRFYVDNGADAIVGHHTHCISGFEFYNEAPIIYSLGNFLFTKSSKREEWFTGSLVSLNIKKDLPIEFEIQIVKQDINTFQTKIINNIEKNQVIEQINQLTSTINEVEHLQVKWQEFILQKSNQYLNSFSPIQLFGNRYLTFMVKKIGIDKLFISKYHYKLLLNLIRCEAHKEISIEIIVNFLKGHK